MNITEYAEQARSVAIYPQVARVYYPILGITGEIGEFVDKLVGGPRFPNAKKSEVTKEAGDILWYLVNATIDTGHRFKDLCVAAAGGKDCLNFTELSTTLRLTEDKRCPLTKLTVYTGQLAEVAKKMLRDTEGVMPPDKAIIFQDTLIEILIAMFEICEQWDITMDDVAQGNINKLFSRRDRGVLKGSGDNR